MRKKFPLIRAALAAVVLCAAVIGVAHGHGDEHGDRAYGKAGDPKKPARTVEIVMKENEGDYAMMFIPNRVEVHTGEQIRFRLRNAGVRDHEFVLATLEDNLAHMKEMAKNPDMEHDDPNARRLKPKETAEIVWQFTTPGQFDFSCLIPGHRQAGMFGTVIVK